MDSAAQHGVATHLGENCTVWNDAKREQATRKPGFSTLSCVTDDGIELGQRSGAQPASTHRRKRPGSKRPVAPEEATPSDLLDLDWWDHGVAATRRSRTLKSR